MTERTYEIAKTKLGVGYVTTVPSAVRKFLGISRGDRIVWCIKDMEIVVRREGELEKEEK